MESSGIFEEVPCHKPVRKSLLKVPIFKKFDNARYQFYFSVNSNQSDTSLRWIHTHLFPMFCMKLRIRLKNLKGVFVSVWLNIETSDRLLAFFRFRWLTLPMWSHDQPLPGSFSQRQMEAEEKEPGNKVAAFSTSTYNTNLSPTIQRKRPTCRLQNIFFYKKNNSKIECITRTNR